MSLIIFPVNSAPPNEKRLAIISMLIRPRGIKVPDGVILTLDFKGVAQMTLWCFAMPPD